MSTLRSFFALIAVLGCTLALAQEQSERQLAKAAELSAERQEIITMAQSTMSRLRTEAPESAELIDKAHGYAVFDVTKGGLVVSGAGGRGVAQLQGGREPVFMRMRSVGIGLTAGGETYKLVALFEDAATYERFLDGGWDVGSEAQAAAGDAAVGAVTTFKNGVAVFHLSDGGLIGNIDVSGAKFSRDDDLNASI
jgi:lipid-binding SYLF domain-containing protein